MHLTIRCRRIGQPALQLVATLLGTCSILMAGPATAQTSVRKVAYFSTLDGETTSALRDAIPRAIAEATRHRPGLSMVEPTTLAAANRDLDAAVARCGRGVACIANRLVGVGLDLGLLITVLASTDEIALAVTLIDVRTTAELFSGTGLTTDEHGLADEIRRLVRLAFDKAGEPVGAELSVEIQPSDAKVQITSRAGVGYGVGPIVHVRPGQYDVFASADGYEAGSTSVTVQPGGRAVVQLALQKKSSVWSSPWLWTAVGVVVAGGTTAAIVAAQPGRTCICVRGPIGTCPPCQ